MLESFHATRLILQNNWTLEHCSTSEECLKAEDLSGLYESLGLRIDHTVPDYDQMEGLRLARTWTRAWDLTSSPQTVKKIAAITTALSTIIMIADEFSPNNSSCGATVDIEDPARDCGGSRLVANHPGSSTGVATVTWWTAASLMVLLSIVLQMLLDSQKQLKHNEIEQLQL